MNLSRRGFIGVLAAAPVGIGGAVRKLTQRAGHGALLGGLESGCEPPALDGVDEISKWDAFAKFGMPDWAKDDIRNHNKPYDYDPDLEVLNSISPVAKYRIQHQRNITRAKIYGPKYNLIKKLKDKFRKEHNTEWL